METDYEVSWDLFPSEDHVQQNVFLHVWRGALHYARLDETASVYAEEDHPLATAKRDLLSRTRSGRSDTAIQTCRNRFPSRNGKSWCVRLLRCPEGQVRNFAPVAALLSAIRAGTGAAAADGRWDSCCDCEEVLLAATLICCLLFA